jgi:hypothetical protein
MNEKSLNRSSSKDLAEIDLDKDTWIYTYGSSKLQQARSFGYECDEQYLKERLKFEYPRFKINLGSDAIKSDCPSIYAIRESLRWNDAYIAKQSIRGEVVAIDHYLGKYQIIKKTSKPWYLIYQNLGDNESMIFSSILMGIFMSFVFFTILWI